MHGVMRNAYKILMGNLKEKDNLRDVGINGTVILGNI
jgi:hypothetical protein